jgi:hypothetical protein
MVKYKDSADNIKIAMKYYLKPLVKSVIITALLFLIIFSQKNEKARILKLCSTFYDMGITFSLTFTAFAITALALLQLLQTKDWFKEVSNSKYYKSFLKRFLFSVKMCLIFFISILFHFSIINYSNLLLCYFSIIVFFLCLIFIVLWTYDCISDFIILFK